MGRKIMCWSFMCFRYLIQQRMQLLSSSSLRLPSRCLLGWKQMRLRYQLLPRRYDLGELLLQEQLNQMFRRHLRIQRNMRSSLQQMPIRTRLEQHQRMYPNQQHLPNRILLQRLEMYPIRFMRKRKSLERYSQSMRLPIRIILKWSFMCQMCHWTTLCQRRMLLPRRNLLRWNPMCRQDCR